MKLITYRHNNKTHWGAIRAGDALEPAADMEIVELGTPTGAASLAEALARSALPGESALATMPASTRFGDVQLLAPIQAPEKIVCVGVNYANRNEEYRDNQSAAAYPSLFIRFPDSLVASGATIIRPPESEQLDYEGEIVVVIGRGGRRIDESEAQNHVAGLSVMNEGTIRDWLRHSKFNVTQGKNFVATGAIGPWLQTLSACPPLDNLSLSTHVNGELRQQDNTQRMMFPIRRLIAYISTFMLLKPGDVIATGTPTGAGARFDPPRWLVPGDEVVVTVDGVGRLRNRVADE